MSLLVLVVVLGVAGCDTAGRSTSAPSPSTPVVTSSPEPEVTPPALSTGDEPAPTDWLSALEGDGTTLWVTAHRCPGQVQQGQCVLWRDFRTRLGPRPVGLWRYAGGRWVGLGRPGVASDAVMHALPGGLLFVRSGPYDAPRPLRVSADEGRTWRDWPIPDAEERCVPNSAPCTVVAAGSYVVVASNNGWVRREIHSETWDDITPPKHVVGGDLIGYGILVLADGTLVATMNPVVNGEGGGHYLVLREGGTAWSAPRANPGESSQVVAIEGTTLFATCWRPASGITNMVDAISCGEYRTSDLQHWTRTVLPPGREPEHGAVCRRVWSGSDPELRETAVSERVGSLVYGIARVLFRREDDDRPTTLRSLDLAHPERLVLERSSDGCASWSDVLP